MQIIEALRDRRISEGASEYYTSEHGVWYGKGAERIGLPSEVTKEDFIAIANNRDTANRGKVNSSDQRHPA